MARMGGKRTCHVKASLREPRCRRGSADACADDDGGGLLLRSCDHACSLDWRCRVYGQGAEVARSESITVGRLNFQLAFGRARATRKLSPSPDRPDRRCRFAVPIIRPDTLSSGSSTAYMQGHSYSPHCHIGRIVFWLRRMRKREKIWLKADATEMGLSRTGLGRGRLTSPELAPENQREYSEMIDSDKSATFSVVAIARQSGSRLSRQAAKPAARLCMPGRIAAGEPFLARL